MNPKRLLAIFLLFALAVAIVLPASAADEAAANFKSKCAMCHGADAAGKTIMGAKLNIRDLSSPEVQKQSDSELTSIIAKGRNKMPAQEQRLNGSQINDVVKYIRTLAKK